MKKILRTVIALMLIALLVIGAVGCGGAGETADGLASMTIGSVTDIDTLNPLASYKQLTFELFMLMYDPLVRYDENYDPKSALATEWSVSDDELTWTFTLSDAAKWHDGTPVTSADVKFTYELMMDTGLGYMYCDYLTGITAIDCPDDNTIILITEEPKANMLMNSTPILPQHIWSEVAEEELETWANETPVGSGPYKFDSRGQGFTKLVKNADYHGTQGFVDEFIFVEYANADTLAQAFKLGEVDAATNLSAVQRTQLSQDSSVEASVISGEVPGFMQVGINVWADSASGGNPLLKNKSIRQALEYAINKQKVLEMAYGGEGKPGTTLINPGDEFHYEPAAGELRDYNEQKANELLEAAGYKDTNGDGVREDAKGNPLEFEFLCIADNIEEVKTGQMVASDAAKVGIKINCVTMDDGAMSDRIVAGDYDMFFWGWGADIDPTVILGILTTDQIGGNNEPFFSNARYDELFALQQKEMELEARKQMVFEMQKIVYDEAPYIIMLYDNNVQAIRTDRWTGFKQVPETGTYFFNITDYNYMNIKPVE